MTNEKLVGKIRKLMALAGSNHEAESMSAMMKAQELMAQYGISASEIEDEEPVAQEEIVKGEVDRARFRWWMKNLASVISKNTFTFVYIRNDVWEKNDNATTSGDAYQKRTKIVFLGRQSHVEIAKDMYQYAYKVLKHGLSSRGYTKSVQKNDYALGFINALQKKFQENVDSKALVIVPDEGVMQVWEDTKLKKAKSANVKTGDMDAYSNGFSDGKNFDPKIKRVEKK